MKNLQLNLFKKWFNMTASGEKTEDYREFKPYWIRCLMLYRGRTITVAESKMIFINYYLLSYGILTFKKFSNNIMSNGYAKDRPQITLENKGIRIGTGIENWGYEGNDKVFIISHGELL